MSCGEDRPSLSVVKSRRSAYQIAAWMTSAAPSARAEAGGTVAGHCEHVQRAVREAQRQQRVIGAALGSELVQQRVVGVRKAVEPVAQRRAAFHHALRRAACEGGAPAHAVRETLDLRAAAPHPDVGPGRDLRVDGEKSEAQPPQGRAGGEQALGEGADPGRRVRVQPSFARQPVDDRLDLPARAALVAGVRHAPRSSAAASACPSPRTRARPRGLPGTGRA